MNDDNGQIENAKWIRFERLLPGPIERVWTFLTDSEQLPVWFGGVGMKYVIEPRLGGEVNLADGHIRGVVTQWQPPRLLGYTWNVFMPGESESRYPVSYVTFELNPQGNDVRLNLTHGPVLDGFETQSMMGWHTFLEMLGSLAKGEQPEPREAVMARNRVRYGVTEIKR